MAALIASASMASPMRRPQNRRAISIATSCPLINSHKIELLDDARLIAQIVGLERRTARGGSDCIDHAPNAHDDLANAVAGVVSMLATNADDFDELLMGVRSRQRSTRPRSDWQQQRYVQTSSHRWLKRPW